MKSVVGFPDINLDMNIFYEKLMDENRNLQLRYEYTELTKSGIPELFLPSISVWKSSPIKMIFFICLNEFKLLL